MSKSHGYGFAARTPALNGENRVPHKAHSRQVELEELEDRHERGTFPADANKKADKAAVTSILTHFGEDPQREGLQRTPSASSGAADPIDRRTNRGDLGP